MFSQAGFGLVFELLIGLVLYVIIGLTDMRLAKIAGRPNIEWMAWVPICSTVLPLLLIKKSGWWLLIYLVPIANIVFFTIWQVKLLKAFGKHGAFVLLAIFLYPVYDILWLVWAYSSDTRYTLNDNLNEIERGLNQML
ncbi:DUF5684 domain-containing protein [Alicyclobacillus fastidiosus]|uniref:DUF5684 domain-containing protein n=1 Tax=Alicyclobacillus fastidiosus TaxID=392011 RepID=A0ABV5AJP6_9BACL|nr:DUF5684 domain-containing protein [Alicyclobacillus fastidiosus]WEH09098.1 DUF5684 domain-containing protein [Alicyclobacillus fastidiosus]